MQYLEDFTQTVEKETDMILIAAIILIPLIIAIAWPLIADGIKKIRERL